MNIKMLKWEDDGVPHVCMCQRETGVCERDRERCA